ncbi:mandelate racemase/muconate lactonizing enzyme family protein [Nakamurella lactea]|uniref:mandelate racemase/muconate lactonizing enzyme family protein n=1 Tax=Nakamurella lactea TaxID=459515 RepID=UPI0004008E89|nr:mandelate racemase/muconate lactonizing enzyme family protein [Nakamurella lactea]
MPIRTIESVDAFYLSMPTIDDVGDGSQDMLLVRVAAAGQVGWGECEAAPLPSIASLICPPSHSACRPVLESVLGMRLETPADIAAVVRRVRTRSLDLLQAPHMLSGIEIALWDLLGRCLEAPVYSLLGSGRSHPKVPYASVLFGDSPEQTLAEAKRIAAAGFRAVKFGWGQFGRGTVPEDADQLHAAREGIGPDRSLLVDAGTVWVDDVDAASERVKALEECAVDWLEEPFISHAIGAYRTLASHCRTLKLAGGEGSHDPLMADNLMRFGNIGVVQIDTGRVGGIGDAARVALSADRLGVQFVNHTFTSHLALSASLQPYVGLPNHGLCEYPIHARSLATQLTRNHLAVLDDGLVRVPEAPGLGMEVDLSSVADLVVDVQIIVDGQTRYRTPEVAG